MKSFNKNMKQDAVISCEMVNQMKGENGREKNSHFVEYFYDNISTQHSIRRFNLLSFRKMYFMNFSNPRPNQPNTTSYRSNEEVTLTHTNLFDLSNKF